MFNSLKNSALVTLLYVFSSLHGASPADKIVADAYAVQGNDLKKTADVIAAQLDSTADQAERIALKEALLNFFDESDKKLIHEAKALGAPKGDPNKTKRLKDIDAERKSMIFKREYALEQLIIHSKNERYEKFYTSPKIV